MNTRAEQLALNAGWTPERIDTLTRLWAGGLSASKVARKLGGVTRNAVIGKVHRMNLQRGADMPEPEPEPPPPEPIIRNTDRPGICATLGCPNVAVRNGLCRDCRIPDMPKRENASASVTDQAYGWEGHLR